MRNNTNEALFTLALVLLLTGCASVPEAPEKGAAAPVADSAVQSGTEKQPQPKVPESAPDGAKGTGGTLAKAGTEPSGDDADEKAKKARQRQWLIPGTGTFIKPAAPAPAPAAGDIALNFEGADLREVVRVVLGDMLHENYTIDPKVNGTVTIHTSQPVARAAVPSVLDTVLRMNGAAMVKDESGIYKIAPIAAALRGNSTPHLGDVQPGYSVQVVQLQYIAAREMAKILEPLVPEGSIVRVDETRNLLMLAGGESEIRHAVDTISVFDVDWLAGMSVGLFTLQSVSVKELMPEIESLFGEKSKGPFGGMVRVIPIERMNAVFIVTPRPQYLEQAKTWIERLDRNGGKSGTRLFVYKVQNGKADKIASLLSQVIGGKSSGATSQPSVAPGLTGTSLQSSSLGTSGQSSSLSGGLSSSSTSGFGSSSGTSGFGSGGGLGNNRTTTAANIAVTGSGEALGLSAGSTIRVIADVDNNALLILANAAEYEKIEEAVRKLDVVPRQVLVEVSIVEVNLNGALNYGLEWFFNNANNLSGTLYNNNATVGSSLPVNSTGTAFSPSGTLPKSSGAFSAVWHGPTGDVKAVLSALASMTKTNVLSSPHIMVVDNQVAKINVGQSVPISGGTTATTTSTLSSIQYVDVGVLLSVRPHINSSGLVTMEINQEVSDVASNSVSVGGTTTSSINKRSAQTTVAVQSGETMVLGGLITDTKGSGSNGVPFLSELPVVGALFGSKTNSDTRRELIVTITPKVVTDSEEARAVTAEFRKKLTGLRPWKGATPLGESKYAPDVKD